MVVHCKVFCCCTFEFWLLFVVYYLNFRYFFIYRYMESEGEHLPGEGEALIGVGWTHAALPLSLSVFRPRAPLFPRPLLLQATAIRNFFSCLEFVKNNATLVIYNIKLQFSYLTNLKI